MSHQTIYPGLFIEHRRILEKSFLSTWGGRHSLPIQACQYETNGLGQITTAVSVSGQPPSVDGSCGSPQLEGRLDRRIEKQLHSAAINQYRNICSQIPAVYFCAVLFSDFIKCPIASSSSFGSVAVSKTMTLPMIARSEPALSSKKITFAGLSSSVAR